MTMTKLTIDYVALVETTRILQASTHSECVLLWLAAREGQNLTVKEVYRPAQRTSADYFEIPRDSMAAVMARLRMHSLSIAAQVHTHPDRAFHSAADERWAIVRHVGALSVVIPDFARNTRPEDFFDRSAIFRLDEQGRWQQMASATDVLTVRGP
jgi:proteasome lid subunit RPN8/RPN11